MVKVVIDTNILIRPLIIPTSSLEWILEAFYEGSLQLIFSSQLVQELTTVLTYPRIYKKYHLDQKEIEKLIGSIYAQGLMVFPSEKVHIVRDEKDNMLLEAAHAGIAEYIVTSDDDLLTLKEYEGIKIVTPAHLRKLLLANK